MTSSYLSDNTCCPDFPPGEFKSLDEAKEYRTDACSANRIRLVVHFHGGDNRAIREWRTYAYPDRCSFWSEVEVTR